MYKFISLSAAFALLVACTDPQPFTFGQTAEFEGEEEILDETDPNVTVNSLFAYDRERGLTMNSVSYDATEDELVINNLPFDGPDGRYDFTRDFGGGAIYESRQTATTGQVQHYAVFLQSDHMTAAAAAGVDWADFGYGGSNINRDSFSLPDDGEYVYLGDYLAVRTFDERSGIDLVSGDVRILLDVNDFDPTDPIQGAITGTIFNRSATLSDGTQLQDLQNVSLAVIEFNFTDGTFSDGTSSTTLADGEPGGSGTFDGFLAGENSVELGANVVLEGPAYSQIIRFQVATYEYPVTTTILGVTTTSIREGTASGLTTNNTDAVQAAVNFGIEVPLIPYNPIDLPPGATLISVDIESELYISETGARELGVLVTDVVPD